MENGKNLLLENASRLQGSRLSPALPRGWFISTAVKHVCEMQFSIQTAEWQRNQEFRALEASSILP